MRARRPSYESLYEADYRQVVGLLIALGGDPATAEELAQDAFVKLWIRWARIGTYDDPGAWVRHVAVRGLISHRRKEGTRARYVAAPTDASSAGVFDNDEKVDLANAITHLPLSQRQVLVLFYTLGMPLKEVAQLLDVSLGTVQSRLARAREALAALLSEENQDA